MPPYNKPPTIAAAVAELAVAGGPHETQVNIALSAKNVVRDFEVDEDDNE
jgi:hypothetical protein